MNAHDRSITRSTSVGLVAIVAGLAWMTGVSDMLPEHGERQPAPAVRPFSERMGCQPWEPGLSRTVTVIATEDESGAVRSMQCVRVKERGILRRVG